jgi:hypothetical protein
VHPMSPANASSPWSSSSASQLLSDGRASPALASRHVQLTQKATRIIKRKPCPSRRPPPIYIMTTPATFVHIVQEVTGCPVHTSSGVRRQAAIASESSYLPPPPTVSMLSTLDTLTFFFLIVQRQHRHRNRRIRAPAEACLKQFLPRLQPGRRRRTRGCFRSWRP